MIFKIYKIVNKVNNKIYIGQTHFDKPSYLGSGILIKAAIEKYGIENFDKEYIDEATNQKDLDLKEIYWIKEYQSQNPDIGYNIADGGWNMCTMNDHIATKISKTLIGKYVGANAFRFGTKITQKHKDAISKANSGRIMSDATKEKLSKAHTGKTFSAETKEKLSKAHKGKTLSAEHKQKISEAGKGRTYTEFQKEKLRMSNLGKTQKHSRTILALCIKTNMPKEFNNISEAARFFNTTHQRIKNNTVADWDITVNDPLIHINDLKKHNNDSES